MSNVIGIVNYGIAGNIHSIEKALKKAGAKTLIINKTEDFTKADKLVLPGVGSFKDAMKELKNDGFIDALSKNTKPILGICLGMQILSTVGFEYGQTTGFNLVDAEVRPILVDAKVPHVGFNTIEVVNTNKVIKGLEKEEFYKNLEGYLQRRGFSFSISRTAILQGWELNQSEINNTIDTIDL